MMAKRRSFTIGFDLGGTKLAAALVRDDGEITDFIKIPLHLEDDASPGISQKRVVTLMADIALDFKRRFPEACSSPAFRGVGLASAGPMNVEAGELIHPANFKGWKVVPLQRLVQEAIQKRGFRTEVAFQNDAIACAYAESWVGGAREMKSFVVITVGTGIGSGVILNGRPCQSRGAGSEFGHTMADLRALQENPDSLRQLTVEGIASGTALLRRAREMGFEGKSVEELVASKKAKYQVLYDDMAWALALLCYNLSIGFHLDGIFVSGGLIKVKELYFPKMKERYRRMIRQFNPLFECPIEVAKTRNNAGVIGAAYLPYLEARAAEKMSKRAASKR